MEVKDMKTIYRDYTMHTHTGKQVLLSWIQRRCKCGRFIGKWNRYCNKCSRNNLLEDYKRYNKKCGDRHKKTKN